MKLCYGDERARWGPAACPGWARASDRERASLTGGRCNPAILPDTAHQNVLTTHLPLAPAADTTDVCDRSGRCGRWDEPSRMRLSWVRQPQHSFVMGAPTMTNGRRLALLVPAAQQPTAAGRRGEPGGGVAGGDPGR